MCELLPKLAASCCWVVRLVWPPGPACPTPAPHNPTAPPLNCTCAVRPPTYPVTLFNRSQPIPPTPLPTLKTTAASACTLASPPGISNSEVCANEASLQLFRITFSANLTAAAAQQLSNWHYSQDPQVSCGDAACQAAAPRVIAAMYDAYVTAVKPMLLLQVGGRRLRTARSI